MLHVVMCAKRVRKGMGIRRLFSAQLRGLKALQVYKVVMYPVLPLVLLSSKSSISPIKFHILLANTNKQPLN
jgi:hypothetical protein